MAERESNFLRLVERGIIGYARSPYLPLLKLAGCELGDIQNMLHARGLESTLRILRESGVYITFEEFKGSAPIIRNGHVIPAKPEDFNNPYLDDYYHAESGGTTGAKTRVLIALDHLAAKAPHTMLAYDAHGVLGVPTALWRYPLPDNTGISNVLQGAVFGHPPLKWFSPVTSHDLRLPLKSRLSNHYILAVGRLFAPIPWPEPVSLDQAAVVARWAAGALEAHGACLIRSSVSQALRVSLAAREERLDLAGATFMAGGEPATPAKVVEITRSGARFVPGYGFTEIGGVGKGCACPADGNDIHLFKDGVALIQFPRRVPGSGISVEAFYFTSLLPSSPKIMVNVESDDYGVIESRSCGCPLGGYGFTDHLRYIRSFRKLTSEGGTLVGSEMVRILEEVLPARFGGSPLDYQLVEEEDDGGFTRLNLLVSPKIRVTDEAAVIAAVLENLVPGERSLWTQARTLRVKWMEPIWTTRGKLMPLHLGEHPGRSTAVVR